MEIAATVDEYLLCRKNALTHDTYKWYVWMLGVFEKWCTEQNITTLEQVTPGIVQQFVNAEPHLSGNTKHHRAQVVKGFLKWCAADEDLGVRAKMVARIEMPKVEQPDVEIYSPEEIQRLLIACESTRYPLRNRALLLLLLDTGIRAAELCVDGDRPEERTGLLFEHVILGKRDRDSESYIIVMGKGRKVRTVKFGDETRLALQRYLNRERPRVHVPYFFLARDNQPLTVRSLQQLLSRLETQTNIRVHAHKFRHTFAIRQLLAGTSSLVLMQLMGHTTLESTKMYTRALSQMQARQASVSVVDEQFSKRKKR